MKTLLVAIHGILTNQTNASWPDKLDAWMFDYDPEIKVLKKEYRAGPFPRWNCRVKDPHLAASLANELELFLNPRFNDSTVQPFNVRPSLWFVAHSNGAVIALLTAKILIERGYPVAGLILTGAACEADIAKNGILDWLGKGTLAAAIAYSSQDDKVVAGDPNHLAIDSRPSALDRVKSWVWGKLMHPYGCLGRTGWLLNDWPLPASLHSSSGPKHEPLPSCPTAFTRWYKGGHSTYFKTDSFDSTFRQILRDINSVSAAFRLRKSPGLRSVTRHQSSKHTSPQPEAISHR